MMGRRYNQGKHICEGQCPGTIFDDVTGTNDVAIYVRL